MRQFLSALPASKQQASDASRSSKKTHTQEHTSPHHTYVCIDYKFAITTSVEDRFGLSRLALIIRLLFTPLWALPKDYCAILQCVLECMYIYTHIYTCVLNNCIRLKLFCVGGPWSVVPATGIVHNMGNMHGKAWESIYTLRLI